jgi:hypothetical protein
VGLIEAYWKPIAIAAASALIAFFLGVWSESAKLRASDERASIENRRKILLETANDFGTYLTQWSRLRAFATAEERLKARIELAKECAQVRGSAVPAGCPKPGEPRPDAKALAASLAAAMDRKDRYVQGRDAAKDRLVGKLEQARFFFGQGTSSAISGFEAFEAKNSVLSIAQLPTMEQWRSEAKKVLSSMSEEIKNEEARLFASPISLGAN